MINIVQPAIVLLNPGKDEGSLAVEPRTKEAEEDMKYWKKRAFIYRMGKLDRSFSIHAYIHTDLLNLILF